MSADLLVRGALVVADAGGQDDGEPLDVAVADGLVAAIGPELDGPAREVLDARGLHLLPGAVDAHVHLNEPGRAHWEGFDAGTRAAAAGGTTVVVDMPLNAHPPTVDAAAFDAKRRCGERAALVDFALWGGLVPGGVERLDELAACGVVGFKAFMSDSGIEDFPRVDELTLYEGMRRAAALGLPVAVHAESEAITAALAARARSEGRRAMRDYLDSRPLAAELAAIATAIALAEEAGCALHVVHVSTGRGVRLVAEARGRGVDVSCETCPHYLLLDDEDAERLGALAKCAPPLRPAAEREALWAALADGSLPMVASDHSPAPPEMKAGDALSAWGGIAGVQTMLALLLGEAPRRGIGLRALCAATSGFPAARLGLAGKGALAVGADADMVLVDLGAEAELRPEDLLGRHRHSPFAGRSLRARVRRTLVRGRTVFADGRAVGPPAGRLVTPDRRSRPVRAPLSTQPEPTTHPEETR